MLTGRCREPTYLLELECRRVTEFDGLDGLDLPTMKKSASLFLLLGFKI